MNFRQIILRVAFEDHARAFDTDFARWSLSGNKPLARRGFEEYLSRVSTVQEIAEAIEQLPVKEQVQLLSELPRHLKISADDAAWLKLAEPSFAFWDNPDDAIYDTL